MSDWRKRATPVAKDWRSRAEPVTYDGPTPEEAAAMPVPEPSKLQQMAEYIRNTPGRVVESATSPKFAQSFAGGHTLGVVPYLSAAVDTVPEVLKAVTGNPADVGGKYTRSLDRIRAGYDAAEKAEPVANFVGQATSPNLAGKGAAGARLLSAGASSGINAATHDGNAFHGSAAGAGVQLGAETLSPALGRLGGRYLQRGAEVRATKAAKDAEEMLASRTGRYGQKVQDAERTTENLARKLDDPNVDEELKTQIRFFLSSDEGIRQTNQIAANSLERAPHKFDEMASLKALRDSAPEDAAKETADYFAKSTLRHDVLPRAKNYAARFVPQAVGSAVGDMAGGAKGVAAGVAGALSGAALGKPGTSIANLLQKTPRFSSKLFDTLGSVGAGKAVNQAPAAAGAAGNALESYLRPQDDEERQKQAADWFTSGGRNR